MKLLKATRLVDGTGAEPIRNAGMLVEGLRVKAVGHADDFGTEPAAELLDLGELTLVPGLVDTHMHLTGSGTTSAPQELEHDSDELLLLRCATNAQTALREGVTTFRDCGARNSVIFTFREAVRRKVLPSPRLLAAGGAITWTGGYAWFFGVEADTPDEVRKAIRRQVRLDADFIKIMVTGGITYGPTLAALHYDADTMRMAVEEAAKMQRLVAAHCLSVEGIHASVAGGVRTIEHCAFFDPLLRQERYDATLAAEIVRKSIYVNPSHAYCYLASAAALDDPAQRDSMLGQHARMHTSRAVTTRLLWQAGVKLIPGSDAGWFGQPFGEYAIMPKLFVEEVGMSPKEAFEACTRIAAEAIGLGAAIGSLEPGKLADAIAVEGDPTVDVSALGRVQMTMLDGGIAFRAGPIGEQKRLSPQFIRQSSVPA